MAWQGVSFPEFRSLSNTRWHNPAGVELPDYAAAREFAMKVMLGLVQSQDDDWDGWTMEVTQGERTVWRIPFEAIEPSGPLSS